jgi:hypothetical protein
LQKLNDGDCDAQFAYRVATYIYCHVL